MKNVFVRAAAIRKFIWNILLKAGVRDDVARHVACGLVQTSLRGVDSHGVRLLPHYLAAVKGGRINPKPNYKFERTSPSTGKLDADHTFGHAAGIEATKKAVEIAEEAGSASIAVYNSTHFGAAAYYSLEIAKHDMIGLVFTHADSLLKTYGGKRPFLGTNPISFSAPCEGEDPFCLDMATSVVTFNKIKQLRDQKLLAPVGVGADSEGIESVNPNEITMLLPIGGYKGYGLSLMVEVLCSMLTGMPYGPYLSKMFADPLDKKRFLAHFIIAIKIDVFQDKKVFKKRMSRLMHELRKEPPLDKAVPVQVAGDPEKRCFKKRAKRGIPLRLSEYRALKNISEEYKVDFDL